MISNLKDVFPCFFWNISVILVRPFLGSIVEVVSLHWCMAVGHKLAECVSWVLWQMNVQSPGINLCCYSLLMGFDNYQSRNAGQIFSVH